MGGNNAYTFGPEDTLFYEETLSGTEVQVWTTDQGASFPDWQVCHDLIVVLRATRQSAETGQLDETECISPLPPDSLRGICECGGNPKAFGGHRFKGSQAGTRSQSAVAAPL